MFSKLTVSLAMMSLMFASSAFAQTKKADQKKVTEAKTREAKKAEAKKAEEARLAEAAKKAEEEKALEAKRLEEAKVAAEKAEEQPTSTGPLGYVRSHFSASYHGEYYLVRKDITSANEEDHDIQDLRIMHNPTIIYRPINNLKLLVTSEFKYTDAEDQGTYINRHFRSLVLLTRENILTEKENGIKMDVGIGRRVFDRNHGLASSYGNSRVNTSLSKKINEQLSTSLLAQYLANDPAKGKISKFTWKHSLELIPSFTYQITEKISYFFNDDFIINTPWHGDTAKNIDISHEMNVGFISYQHNDKNSSYFQFKYLHLNQSNPKTGVGSFQEISNTTDYFDYYIGHTYSFTPKISVTAEVGSTIFASRDNRFFAKNVEYPEFALYLDWAL